MDAKERLAWTRLRVGPQGRIVIPASVREEMRLGVGEELLARIEDGRLVLERREEMAHSLKERFAKVAPGRSLSEELIAERREETLREEARSEAQGDEAPGTE